MPFPARWPGRIPAGAVQDEVICLTDIMATVAAVVEFRLLDDAGEDSYDVHAALFGEAPDSALREATVHHRSRRWFGIRQGDWVLIDHPRGDSYSVGPNREPEWLRRERLVTEHAQEVELFNLRDRPCPIAKLGCEGSRPGREHETAVGAIQARGARRGVAPRDETSTGAIKPSQQLDGQARIRCGLQTRRCASPIR